MNITFFFSDAYYGRVSLTDRILLRDSLKDLLINSIDEKSL